MSSRDHILREVRRSLPADAPLPSLDRQWTRYDDPHAQFFEVLRSVGGAGRTVAGEPQLREEIDRVIAAIGAQQICSVIPEAAAGNVDIAAIEDPHDLASVDLAILPGELAVAENAAVWVTGARVRQRVAYFLSQHVVLVIPYERIANNMHEAYAWLQQSANGGSPFGETTWGTFMSGLRKQPTSSKPSSLAPTAPVRSTSFSRSRECVSFQSSGTVRHSERSEESGRTFGARSFAPLRMTDAAL